MNLYDELVAAGIEIDHHCSDLYFPKTEQSMAILAKYSSYEKTITFFKNQMELSETWVEVPFAYLPFWAKNKSLPPYRLGKSE
jgi:hypothetical protein